MPSDMAYRKEFGSWGKAMIECGFEIKKPYPSEQCRKAVSIAKKGKMREESSHWKGGRRKDKINGYILLWDSEQQRYVPEHRKIMENYIGEKLGSDYDVHHINGIKDDNRLENLKIIKKSKHTSLHHKGVKKNIKDKKQCIYPNCREFTSSKYRLCNYHYRMQWNKLSRGTILNIYDFRIIERKHTEETKKRLSDIAKKQPRKNGKFA